MACGVLTPYGVLTSATEELGSILPSANCTAQTIGQAGDRESSQRQQDSSRTETAGGEDLDQLSLFPLARLPRHRHGGETASFLILPWKWAHVQSEHREPHSDVAGGPGACWLTKLTTAIWLSTGCWVTCSGGEHGGGATGAPALAVLGHSWCGPSHLLCPTVGKAARPALL